MDVRGEQRLIADRYLLLERLGSGGMGTVWRATDQLLRRTVALKEVHLLARGEELARRSRRAHREARAIAGISHPNVVDIYDLVDYENRLWLVMELVEGPSLANIAAGSMSPARVAEIGLQLLSALDAVHAVGALHRDVKPSNILLRPDGGVVLCDFGIVALADTESLTQSGAVVGSVEYIAPERLGDQPVGPPSDLFSLGCTLYYLLTGNSPFARPGVAAVLHAVIQEQPDIPKNAGLLGPLIEALLRKNPAERPSVTEAVDMLASVATTATIREFNIGSWSTVSIKPRRRRLFRWVASLAVLVVVSIVGFLVAHSLEGTPPVSDAERTTPVSIPPDSAPRTRVTHIGAVMATPDDPNQFWIFAGSEYVRVSLDGDGSAGRILVGPLPIANWTGTFKGLPGFESKIDAVMPIPGQRNRYWVFSGDQYIQIEVADESYEDTLLTQLAPLSEWANIFGDSPNFPGVIDAVMATPDDPNQFWIFAGSEYVRVSLDGDGSAGRILVGPLPIANWTGTFKGLPGFESKIDAVMPIPGQRNRYWVFSGDQYIQIEVADESYEDTLLTQPAPLSEWDPIR